MQSLSQKLNFCKRKYHGVFTKFNIQENIEACPYCKTFWYKTPSERRAKTLLNHIAKEHATQLASEQVS
jgi:ABC-type proline/glycine betaine transport system ATPase subunit